ncbi:hypothetical protein H310_11302 [Aphanomyces invadans]|uniref:PH domain-containing protein n=1 Tax=Aphanomyces invadans TaxID=157072 RepID=A0A024TQ44_9STRA|nr:hypothetical protein H310_11302 [Aphanomyces invadans]ETV95432.1 hypothetical protein H310_11302 [Aphanomyces invadans]|eukprot:XP_008876133.1 hypothetical protein H310_11302 [Aphanomyces invadans]
MQAPHRDSDGSDLTPMLESSRSMLCEPDTLLRSPPLGPKPLQRVREDAALRSSIAPDTTVRQSSRGPSTGQLASTFGVKEPEKLAEDIANAAVRRGFVRIYFENSNFTSSTVLRVEEHTSVLEVRQIMANKMRLSSKQQAHHAILMLYVNSKGSSMSARTLKDNEFIYQVQEAIHSERQSVPEIVANEVSGPVRAKPRHRARQTLKFIFKDIRGKPIDLEAELELTPNYSNPTSALSQYGHPNQHNMAASQDTVFLLPQKLGLGLRAGTLKKASLKDANVWRSRWFVLKDDKLYYCKSEFNQRDITAIPLLNAQIVKQDALVPHCFELHTSRRVYRFCSATDDSMMAWIHALHREIRLAAENQMLTKAESFIVDEAVTTCERNQDRTPFAVSGILGYPALRKMFRDFMASESMASVILLDTWAECDLFRRNGLVRFQSQLQQQQLQHQQLNQMPNHAVSSFAAGSAQDEWDHVKRLLLQYIPAAQKAGAHLQTSDIDLCRQSLHDNQKHRRLSIAMDHDNSHVTDFPSPNLFLNVQQDILRALEEGPFQRYIAGRGYTRIIDRTIRR